MGRTQCQFVAISLCAACGRVGFDETVCEEPWGPAVEIVTGLAGADNPSISADERDLYVDSGGDLYVMHRADRHAPWSAAVPLAMPPNASSADSDPSISGDGLDLYFVKPSGGGAPMARSHRSSVTAPFEVPQGTGAYGGGDVAFDQLSLVAQDYMSPITEYRRATTADPFVRQPPNTVVNDGALNVSPSLSADGRELYFASNRLGGWTLWVARRRNASTELEEVEQALIEPGIESPEISADGHHMYFSSFREGMRRLYVASRCD